MTPGGGKGVITNLKEKEGSRDKQGTVERSGRG